MLKTWYGCYVIHILNVNTLHGCGQYYASTYLSGGVGNPAGPALAGALFLEVMNINIELLMGTTGLPHISIIIHMRSVDLARVDCNGSS